MIATATAARVLSVIGHPALVMPAAVTVTVVNQGATAPAVMVSASATIAVALTIAVYSLLQVRAGRWSHVDASAPQERLHLNAFLACLLLAVSGLQWAMARPLPLVLGLALSSAIVFAAMAMRRWLKVSLHCAFGSYAALLVWPDLPALAALVALVLGVAWSRLELRRHTAVEILTGLALGVLAGVALHVVGAVASIT